MIEKNQQSPNQIFERINKINELLAKLTRKKNLPQSFNSRSERLDVTMDLRQKYRRIL